MVLVDNRFVCRSHASCSPSRIVHRQVCFTNVKPTPKERNCLKKLGISEVRCGKIDVFVSGASLSWIPAHLIRVEPLANGRLERAASWEC